MNIDLKALSSRSPRAVEVQYYDDDDDRKPPSFSASGFKLVGDSVKGAANTKSMINMLRNVGSVSPPKKVSLLQLLLLLLLMILL